MMHPLFKFRILSLDGKYYESDVESVYFEVPEKGLTGLMANYLDFYALLFVSIIYTIKDGQREYFAISGGSINFKDNIATVVADTFERTDEIDEEKIKKAIEDAQKIIDSAVDFPHNVVSDAKFSLQKATNRLRLLK